MQSKESGAGALAPLASIVMTAVALISVTASAQADDTEADVAWYADVAAAAEVVSLPGNAETGRELYAVCAECHLSDGAGAPDGTMPQLAGQHRSVLIKQMNDIREGRRSNPAMYPYVALLDGAQDVADLATYIEGLPPSGENGRGPGIEPDRGEALYREKCASCHGVGGEGEAAAFYPRVDQQHYRYLVRQMIDIASGRRGNSNPEMVRVIEDFSARDVSVVADFMSRLNTANQPIGSD